MSCSWDILTFTVIPFAKSQESTIENFSLHLTPSTWPWPWWDLSSFYYRSHDLYLKQKLSRWKAGVILKVCGFQCLTLTVSEYSPWPGKTHNVILMFLILQREKSWGCSYCMGVIRLYLTTVKFQWNENVNIIFITTVGGKMLVHFFCNADILRR